MSGEVKTTCDAIEPKLAVVLTGADDPAGLAQAARSAWASSRAPERVTWWLVTTHEGLETIRLAEAGGADLPACFQLMLVSSDEIATQRAEAVAAIGSDWVIFTEAGCRHPVGWVEDWVEAIERAEAQGIQTVGGVVEPGEDTIKDRRALAVWLHEYVHALPDTTGTVRPAGCDAAVAVPRARGLVAERGRLFDQEWTDSGQSPIRRTGPPVRYARPTPVGGWISERIGAGESYGQTRPILQAWGGVRSSWLAALALTPLIAALQTRGLVGSLLGSARGRDLAWRAGIALVAVVLGWSWGEARGSSGLASRRDEDSPLSVATSS